MRCSRYRPISEGATGRPPIYPAGFQPKEFNQRDLPYRHHTRSHALSKRGPPGRAPRSKAQSQSLATRYAALGNAIGTSQNETGLSARRVARLSVLRSETSN
jgi:hypothetical protein